MQLSIYASNLICLAFERFWLLAGEGAHVFVIAWPPDERFSPRPCKCSTLSPWAQPTTWSQDCTVMSLCSMLTPKTYSTSHNRKAFDQSDGSSAGAVDMLPVPHVERSLLSAWLTAEILWSDQSADLSSQSGTPLKSRKENDVNFSGKKKKKNENAILVQINVWANTFFLGEYNRNKTAFHCYIQVTEKWRRKLRHHLLKERVAGVGLAWNSKKGGGDYRAKLSRCGCAEESGDAGEERSRDEPEKEGSDPAAKIKSSSRAEVSSSRPGFFFFFFLKLRKGSLDKMEGEKRRRWRAYCHIILCSLICLWKPSHDFTCLHTATG